MPVITNEQVAFVLIVIAVIIVATQVLFLRGHVNRMEHDLTEMEEDLLKVADKETKRAAAEETALIAQLRKQLKDEHVTATISIHFGDPLAGILDFTHCTAKDDEANVYFLIKDYRFPIKESTILKEALAEITEIRTIAKVYCGKESVKK